jgi:hypothetical protein
MVPTGFDELTKLAGEIGKDVKEMTGALAESLRKLVEANRDNVDLTMANIRVHRRRDPLEGRRHQEPPPCHHAPEVADGEKGRDGLRLRVVRRSEPEVARTLADVAVLAAVAGSARGRALPEGTAVFGEVGLLGEVRAVTDATLRLKEVSSLGFSRVLIPSGNAAESSAFPDLDVTPVRSVEELLERT